MPCRSERNIDILQSRISYSFRYTLQSRNHKGFPRDTILIPPKMRHLLFLRHPRPIPIRFLPQHPRNILRFRVSNPLAQDEVHHQRPPIPEQSTDTDHIHVLDPKRSIIDNSKILQIREVLEQRKEVLQDLEIDVVRGEVESSQAVASKTYLACFNSPLRRRATFISSLDADKVEEFRSFPAWSPSDLKSVSAVENLDCFSVDLSICPKESEIIRNPSSLFARIKRLVMEENKAVDSISDFAREAQEVRSNGHYLFDMMYYHLRGFCCGFGFIETEPRRRSERDIAIYKSRHHDNDKKAEKYQEEANRNRTGYIKCRTIYRNRKSKSGTKCWKWRCPRSGIDALLSRTPASTIDPLIPNHH